MNRQEGISESDLIDAMCLTWRHDFGLPFMGDSERFRSGMSAQERDGLRLQMRQLYEHHIRPAIQSAVEAERAVLRVQVLEAVEPYTRVSTLHNYGPSGLSRVEEAEIRTGKFIQEDILALFEHLGKGA